MGPNFAYLMAWFALCLAFFLLLPQRILEAVPIYLFWIVVGAILAAFFVRFWP